MASRSSPTRGATSSARSAPPGTCAIAPDGRGYGGSDAPAAVEAYDILELTGDIVALMDALRIERAPVVGHDWGADTAWKAAWIHPERVSAVAGLSVPYVPRAPAPPVEILRRHLGEDFYIVWFQEPGVADAALAKDVRRTIATTEVWDAAWAAREDDDPRTPRFLSEEDLAVYVEAYDAHRLHRRAQQLPQHRSQLAASRSPTRTAASSSPRCSSPAAAIRCAASCPRRPWTATSPTCARAS